MRIKESLNITFDESLPELKSSPSKEDDRINEPIVPDINGLSSLQVNVSDEGYLKSVKESRAHLIEQVIDDDAPPPPQSQTPVVAQAPHTMSIIKLLILKKGEYDAWAMKMEHYLAHTDYPLWEVIQNEDHLAKIHKMTDAKEMWEAIKSRFGGNEESKKNKANDNSKRLWKKEESQCFDDSAGGNGVDWTSHSEDKQDNYAFMACNSSGSDTEVTSCSKECKESYAELKKLYDEQRAQLRDASIEIWHIPSFKRKLKAQLVCSQQSQTLVRGKDKVSAVGGRRETVVKPSAVCNMGDQTYICTNPPKYNGGSRPSINVSEQRDCDSGCSRHMTRKQGLPCWNIKDFKWWLLNPGVDEFEAINKSRFQMSFYGRAHLLLGLQVKQKEEHLDAKKKFVMYPRFISIFLDKQLMNVPVPLDHFPVNALTSKVFSFMVKKGKHFSGKVTPLFASMLSDPSLRPSPSTHIPDSIPESSGGNHGGQSSSDKSLSGNEGDMTL
ncbi:hypothetical protein Tco_0153955 [Tanacetum coccineum]